MVLLAVIAFALRAFCSLIPFPFCSLYPALVLAAVILVIVVVVLEDITARRAKHNSGYGRGKTEECLGHQ